MSEKDKRIDAWQLVERALSQLNERLNIIENRLNQLEEQQGQRMVLNETRVPDGVGHLGGKSLSTSPSGGVEREIRIPVCDVCGRNLGEEFAICHDCGRKLCPGCIIRYRGTSICIGCLRSCLPLTKKAFKVLVCVANGITKARTVSELTRILRKEVKAALVELTSLGLIVKKGFFIFSDLHATDDGIEALYSYNQAYGRDADVQLFGDELRRHVEENPLKVKTPVFLEREF